jgi:hypothetical protein
MDLLVEYAGESGFSAFDIIPQWFSMFIYHLTDEQ